MSKVRLLKRIRLWENSEYSLADPDIIQYTESVLDDLSKLYNTRRGTVLISEDFGMPDFTNLQNSLAPPDIEFMVKSLKELTDKYESRISDISVEYRPREGELGLLRFTVTGSLIYKEQAAPIQFDALLYGDGRIVIQVQE